MTSRRRRASGCRWRGRPRRRGRGLQEEGDLLLVPLGGVEGAGFGRFAERTNPAVLDRDRPHRSFVTGGDERRLALARELPDAAPGPIVVTAAPGTTCRSGDRRGATPRERHTTGRGYGFSPVVGRASGRSGPPRQGRYWPVESTAMAVMVPSFSMRQTSSPRRDLPRGERRRSRPNAPPAVGVERHRVFASPECSLSSEVAARTRHPRRARASISCPRSRGGHRVREPDRPDARGMADEAAASRRPSTSQRRTLRSAAAIPRRPSAVKAIWLAALSRTPRGSSSPVLYLVG